MGDARRAALSVIEDFRRNGAWPDKRLESAITEYSLDPRDTALCTKLSYGVLQNLLLLDYVIGRYSSIRIKKIQPQVLDILRLAVYEIMFLERIPDTATVNEAVNLTRSRAHSKAAGFVNAVLRGVCDKGIPEIPHENMMEYLSIKYSHPLWLVELFARQIGEDEVERLLSANNAETPVYIQLNSIKCKANELEGALRLDKVDFTKHPWLDGCYILNNPGRIERLAAFKKGLAIIQDPAARFAVMSAGIKTGDTVMDLCAAPGGKSFIAAALVGETGRVKSFDISPAKISRLKMDAKRLGISNLDATASDAVVFLPEYEEKCDAVICDVPCSGFGVIRKKPEIRYKKHEDITSLPKLQLSILQNAARYVKPEGTLVYSTCTMNPAENSEVTERFLHSNESFKAEGFNLPGDISAPEGAITLWPHIHGTDGFYISRFIRKA